MASLKVVTKARQFSTFKGRDPNLNIAATYNKYSTERGAS